MTALPIGCRCGLPQTPNPHPDAGVPSRILEVGTTYECIPCTVKSRHSWATKARELEKECARLAELVDAVWEGLHNDPLAGWLANISSETARRIAEWRVDTGRS